MIMLYFIIISLLELIHVSITATRLPQWTDGRKTYLRGVRGGSRTFAVHSTTCKLIPRWKPSTSLSERSKWPSGVIYRSLRTVITMLSVMNYDVLQFLPPVPFSIPWCFFSLMEICTEKSSKRTVRLSSVSLLQFKAARVTEKGKIVKIPFHEYSWLLSNIKWTGISLVSFFECINYLWWMMMIKIKTLLFSESFFIIIRRDAKQTLTIRGEIVQMWINMQ